LQNYHDIPRIKSHYHVPAHQPESKRHH